MNTNTQYSENFVTKKWISQYYRVMNNFLGYWIFSVTYCIADGLPFDLLLGILLLLQFENMFIEVELKIFIGVIYTKLLKAVLLHKEHT